MSPPEAVTFDFWNTLMWEEAGGLEAHRIDIWMDVLQECGGPVDRGALEAAHGYAHANYVGAWEANRQYVVEDAVAHIIERLDADLPARVHGMLLDGFSAAGRKTELQLCDGVERCISELKAAGVAVGIVCDIGLTPSPVLRWHLEQRGLLHLFDDATFSDEVGYYKPDRRIFERALAGLGVKSFTRAVHVGDRRRTDVAGARAVGMKTVRYREIFDDWSDVADADHIVDDYAALLNVLLG